jgi:hypothetical protein
MVCGVDACHEVQRVSDRCTPERPFGLDDADGRGVGVRRTLQLSDFEGSQDLRIVTVLGSWSREDNGHYDQTGDDVASTTPMDDRSSTCNVLLRKC